MPSQRGREEQANQNTYPNMNRTIIYKTLYITIYTINRYKVVQRTVVPLNYNNFSLLTVLVVKNGIRIGNIFQEIER